MSKSDTHAQDILGLLFKPFGLQSMAIYIDGVVRLHIISYRCEDIM